VVRLLSGCCTGAQSKGKRFRSALFTGTKGGSIAQLAQESNLLRPPSAAFDPQRDDPAERGLIRFLGVLPGQRAAGQALLLQAEETLRERGMDKVVAFHQHKRYPFYHLPSAYLSDRLGHIDALLGWNGYRRIAGEVYMDWVDYAGTALRRLSSRGDQHRAGQLSRRPVLQQPGISGGGLDIRVWALTCTHQMPKRTSQPLRKRVFMTGVLISAGTNL
jgi:hypothetical protein